MKKWIWLIFVPFISIAAEKINLLDRIQYYERLVSSEKFTPANCVQTMNMIFDHLYKLDRSTIDVSRWDREAQVMTDALWNARLNLRGKLRYFYKKRALSRDCAVASNNVIRAARALDEYVSEWKLTRTRSLTYSKTLSKREFYLNINPRYMPQKEKGLRLESGDVIIVRGKALTSSGISVVGDLDSHYSHAAIVYIDEKDHKNYIIEGLMQSGLTKKSFKEFFSEKQIRAAVFRYSGAEKNLARNAARTMAQITESEDIKLPYDFNMDMSDDSKAFCSEVVNIAYRYASAGRVKVPLFKNHFRKNDPAFLKSIGITDPDLFLPADIELDPRFDLVAEWKDVSRVNEARLQDTVLFKFMQWQTEKRFILKPNFFSRQLIWIGSKLGKKVSPDINEEYVRVFGTLLLTSMDATERLVARLEEEKKIRKSPYRPINGLPPEPRILRQLMEKMLKEKAFPENG